MMVNSHLKKPLRKSKKLGSRPTGLKLLDKRMGGGLPEDSLVCIYADPMSMPEAFLYQLASTRKTYYINTFRPVQTIQQNISSMGFSVEEVEFIDIFSQYGKIRYEEFLVESKWKKKEVFTFLDQQLKELENAEEYNLVIDSISFFMRLDVDTAIKDWLLNRLYLLSKESRNQFYMYLMKGVHPTEIVNMVMEISDVIFNIRSEEVGGRIKSVLSIPKIRNKPPVNDTFKFQVDEGVQIDTSKDIA
ncbi:MAG: RAD55 family ATPase [Halobacteriota archaeon]